MALRLTVPTSVSNPSPPSETRPKQLKDWLSSLPLTKLFESARIVCDELARLNRSRISADERLKLLEIYEPTLRQLGAEIAEDYNKAPLPLPPTSRQAVNLARELLIEEAYAYKLALLEKTNRLMLFGTRKQLVPLIEQIMRTLSNSLTLSYQSYLPTPAGVWYELHELYRYASQQKLIEEEAESGNGSSIDRMYKYAVLIALTDPYRLPRAELPDVMRVATQVAPLTDLYMSQAPGTPPLFVILPDTDKPPRPASQPGMDLEQRGADWVVDATALVRRLSEVISERESNAQRRPSKDVLYTVPVEVLHRLIQGWGVPHKRAFRRQAGQATVQICTGVSRICKLLDNAAHANINQGKNHNPSASAEAPAEWDVINQSAVGIKLRGMPSPDAAINVGELIAVQYRGMPALSIGVVRWAQTFEDTSVEVGVQMLAPRAEAVTLEPTIGSHNPQRALLLPEISALQQPAAIVAPPGNYQPNREFVLTQTSQMATVRSSELIEKTTCYELFRFLPA